MNCGRHGPKAALVLSHQTGRTSHGQRSRSIGPPRLNVVSAVRVAKPSKRRPPTRKQLGLEPRYTARKFRPYALAIGEAMLSWNDLHEELGMLFWTVSGGGFGNLPLGIWHSITNDRAKRNILMAAARASLNQSVEREKKAFEEVKWIFDKVGELAGDRNAATHAPLSSTLTTSDVFPQAGFGNRLAQKLDGRDVLAEYRRLRDTAIRLRDYCGRLGDAIARARATLPARPKLPAR